MISPRKLVWKEQFLNVDCSFIKIKICLYKIQLPVNVQYRKLQSIIELTLTKSSEVGFTRCDWIQVSAALRSFVEIEVSVRSIPFMPMSQTSNLAFYSKSRKWYKVKFTKLGRFFIFCHLLYDRAQFRVYNLGLKGIRVVVSGVKGQAPMDAHFYQEI